MTGASGGGGTRTRTRGRAAGTRAWALGDTRTGGIALLHGSGRARTRGAAARGESREGSRWWRGVTRALTRRCSRSCRHQPRAAREDGRLCVCTLHLHAAHLQLGSGVCTLCMYRWCIFQTAFARCALMSCAVFFQTAFARRIFADCASSCTLCMYRLCILFGLLSHSVYSHAGHFSARICALAGWLFPSCTSPDCVCTRCVCSLCVPHLCSLPLCSQLRPQPPVSTRTLCEHSYGRLGSPHPPRTQRGGRAGRVVAVRDVHRSPKVLPVPPALSVQPSARPPGPHRRIPSLVGDPGGRAEPPRAAGAPSGCGTTSPRVPRPEGAGGAACRCPPPPTPRPADVYEPRRRLGGRRGGRGGLTCCPAPQRPGPGSGCRSWPLSCCERWCWDPLARARGRCARGSPAVSGSSIFPAVSSCGRTSAAAAVSARGLLHRGGRRGPRAGVSSPRHLRRGGDGDGMGNLLWVRHRLFYFRGFIYRPPSSLGSRSCLVKAGPMPRCV